jgi:hypothetical protein
MNSFVDLYLYCYPAVENEMAMRLQNTSLNGDFVRDDYVVNGALHAVSWILPNLESSILHFPETYGRAMTVVCTDIWNNIINIWKTPGYYALKTCDRQGILKLLATIPVDAGDEQDYNMGLGLLEDLSINNINVGGNDYSDSLPLISPGNEIHPMDVRTLSAKEFFAISSVIAYYNPPQNTKITKLLKETESTPTYTLESAKQMALRNID